MSSDSQITSKSGISNSVVATASPAPVVNLEPPKPTAWLTKIYSNDGVLLDTRLDFVKPVIMSTAKTEFVPLFATTEGSADE